MLFNCLHCGKSISSKKEICVYCKTDLSQFVTEYNKQRPVAPSAEMKEKYAGTFFSFLLKTKAR